MDSNRHFDLNKLIAENYYSSEGQIAYDNDVFDELNSFGTRFLISEDIVPPPPPPTPDQTPRLRLIIPEEKYDDVELDMVESNLPTPINIQQTLDFSKELLMISSIYDNTICKIPSKKSQDARKIWEYAKIPSVATVREIEYKLLDWAYTYASLEIVDNKIIRITWHSHSNCTCISTWSAFLKWIICSTKSF